MTQAHSLNDVEIAAKAFLNSHDHPYTKEIQFDRDEFTRFPCPMASERSNLDVACKFYSDGVPCGYLKCWHCNIEINFSYKQRQEVSSQEWQVHLKRINKTKLQSQREMQHGHFAIAREAKKIWEQAINIGEDNIAAMQYLVHKNVKNYGLRYLAYDVSYEASPKKYDASGNEIISKVYRGTLLIPIFNARRELVNLERIYFSKKENKFQKRPLKGGERNGAFFLIGEVTNQLEIIYISEGYSTAATIYESTGCPTVVSFNCGNLPHVTKVIRELYPKAKIIIAADRDANGTGEKHAKEASYLVSGGVCLPDFTLLNLNAAEIQQKKLSDFNDLYAELLRKGFSKEAALGEVQLQLNNESVNMIADHKEILSGKHVNDEISEKETLSPNNFSLTDEGLIHHQYDKDGKKAETTVTKRYIKILGRFSDYYSGENFGLLIEFEDENSRIRTWLMPAIFLSDTKTIETALNYRGFFVYDIKKLISFFKASRTNTSFIGVSSIGWHIFNKLRYFVLPMEVVGNGIDQKRIKYQSTDNKNPFQSQGTINDWKENIGKHLTGQPMLLFGVSFALSSLLLDIVGAENGGVHLHGQSSRGKSTILDVCASLFGEPDNYLLSWKTTPNAIERLAVSRHDCALILDESSEFENEHNKKLASVIYMLMNGAGKARLNSDTSLKDTLTWRSNVMSSGENPISELLTSAGERDNEGVAVRLIDLNAIVGEYGVFSFIPSQFKDGREFVKYLQDASRKYYGTVAIALINLLINENPEHIKRLVKTIEEKIIGGLKGAEGQVMRCAGRFALAATAGELLNEILGIKKEEATKAALFCLEVWIKARGGVKDNEATKLLKQVVAYRDAHNAMFKTIGENSTFEKDNQAGYKEKDKNKDNRWVYYATADTFKQMTKGYSHDFAVEALINAGFLTENKKKNGNSKYLRQKKIDGTNSKYYFFDGSMWNMEDPEEVTE